MKDTKVTNRHVHVRPAHIFGAVATQSQSPERFPLGTRDDIVTRIAPNPLRVGNPLDELGDRWFYSFALETVGRNIAMAAGLTLAYKLGLAHAEFEKMRKVNS